ncbi:MAG: hypothetical protein RL577_423 [Bacteroidota bacterium]|jgi:outer membrane protein assembly factor BamA
MREVRISGNHQTHPQVFYRELGYHPGVELPCNDSLIQRWEGRLQSTHLFTSVSILTHRDTLVIDVQERVYNWALPLGGYGDGSLLNWAQSGYDSRRLYAGAELHINNIAGMNRDLRLTAVGGFNRAFGLSFRRPYTWTERDYQWSLQAEHLQSSNLWYMNQNNRVRFYPDPYWQRKVSSQLGGEFRYRFTYHKEVRFQAQSQWMHVDSNVLRDNPNYTLGGVNQFQQSLRLIWVRDYRNQLHYPTKGSEWKINLGMHGQWSAGKQRFVPELESKYRGFWPLSEHSGLAAMGFLRYRLGDLTFALQNQAYFQGEYVRGYENYAFDGQGLALAKLAYRQQILFPSVVTWPFQIMGNYQRMPLQVWANVFADAGQILDPILNFGNSLASKTMHSVGLGVDLLLYYDALLRVDFSRNARGEWVSRLVLRHAI